MAHSDEPPATQPEPASSIATHDLDGAQAAAAVGQEHTERRHAFEGESIQLRGRVVFPPGTPSDEYVRIVARGAPRFGCDPGPVLVTDPGASSGSSDEFVAFRELSPVGLDADRSFDLSVPREWGFATLELRAHWLYCPPEFVQLTESEIQPLEFHPELGAQVIAELLPPAGIGDEELLRAAGIAFVHDASDLLPRSEEHTSEL